MFVFMFTFISLAALFALGMYRAPLPVWAAAMAIFTVCLQLGLGSGELHWPVFNVWALLGWLIAAGLFALTFPEIKRKYLVLPAYRAFKGAMPAISETEREALEAGTVGWDAELFGGQPDWSKLTSVPPITLTDEERAFLDGPTEELCRRLKDWHMRHELHDVPDERTDAKRQGPDEPDRGLQQRRGGDERRHEVSHPQQEPADERTP